MKKYWIAACLCTLMAAGAFAQDEREAPEPEKKGFDKSRLFFGGNFGLGFGNVSTLINVSPQIGYRFNEYLAAGAGVNFIYSSYRYRYVQPEYKEQLGVAGLNIFGRVYPIEFLLLQVQPELNYVWGKQSYEGGPELKLDGKMVPSILGGAGAVIPAGRGAFLAMVNYDLLQNERSPYGSRAFFNFGYNIGF
jgi:hypothetical protein